MIETVHGLGGAREEQRVDALAPFVLADARTLSCAHCRDPMQRHVIEGVEIDECRRCGLHWLDEGELATLVAARTSWSLEALGPSGSPVKREETCPICGRCTSTFRFNAVPHVHLAVCDRHGNWLDDWEGRELTLWGHKEARRAHLANTTPYQRRVERFLDPSIVWLVVLALGLGSLSFNTIAALLMAAAWDWAKALWQTYGARSKTS
jgi:Zn-finger nucleic acid-binding protein